MASGEAHDWWGYFCVPVVAGFGWWITQSPSITTALAIGFGVGITHLSPDVDTKSSPWRRWGPLRLIWVPYQRMGKHRGFSHLPILGTLSRVVYLLVPLLLVWCLGSPAPLQTLKMIGMGIQTYPGELIACWVGLELSALLHLRLDGLL